MTIPKYMEKIDNKLPLDGKQSYIRKVRSYWQLINEHGQVIYEGSRKNWIINYARNHWDEIN